MQSVVQPRLAAGLSMGYIPRRSYTVTSRSLRGCRVFRGIRGIRGRGATVIELLAVMAIGTAALGVLLPAVSGPRGSSMSGACLSNTRRLAAAGSAFAADHEQRQQPVSAQRWVFERDPARTKWAYRTDGSPLDWASSLAAYLVEPGAADFSQRPGLERPAFLCPSDPSMSVSPEGLEAFKGGTSGGGYEILHGIKPESRPYQSISYGVNADLTCLTVNGVGRFNLTQDVVPFGGAPLGGELMNVPSPAQTLWYGDCGTRPDRGPGLNDIDRFDVTYYTSNGLNTGPTLKQVSEAPWLSGKIPLGRHEGAVNIAFIDGHGEMVEREGFESVRISPHANPPPPETPNVQAPPAPEGD